MITKEALFNVIEVCPSGEIKDEIRVDINEIKE